ncbi:E3 ubiquitin-protein ligase BRE1B-like [Nothoprocta perdicaria]|uniref:E3 ubiquitin-protein ligase BRE1B-like n=1 Tax=Nothoprocta perdicaria TaxID=30464 RepID=UPI000E1BDB2D|nr:E3 ubiquitin-protein ligase BRE1B-like [Nothoprocta perdicaria]
MDTRTQRSPITTSCLPWGHLVAQLAELQDKATSAETKVLEMETTVEALQWDSARLRKREQRLNRHLAEALEQLNSGYYASGSSGGFQGGQITLSMQKFEMLNAELESNQELANSRMAELEKLQQELQEAVRGHERLKVALRALPEEAVKETLDYKVLQSQFSLLYNESLQVKTQLDEARALLLATKNSHLRHIEHMEVGALGCPWGALGPLGSLWDMGTCGDKEYEMLRIEFEQNLAANEQAGPINREMRHLISSLQNHNHQLKGDVQRYKRKLREVQGDIAKPYALHTCRKAQESQKEMKLLLDMYKSAPKEQRDKVTLMAAERKSKAEVEELRVRLRELEERERRDGRRGADDDALRRLRAAEEQIEQLQRKLAATKQEEEALLSEMDVTGQAFEDMQEQNLRLLQQLREKDDANFKLMSERIKANQIHKLLRDEKDELAEQVLALKAQVDAQLLLVQKLEEKERLLQGSLGAVEKELALRAQALELNKRKAVEAAQLAEDLRAQGEHVQGRLRELQLEKQSKVEVYADADQILQEEIREYRARLTCPCCNARRKDAVLTKCFHVFCFECVRSRYETRQRKCPKCNAAFGAHDFHRVYIS